MITILNTVGEVVEAFEAPREEAPIIGETGWVRSVGRKATLLRATLYHSAVDGKPRVSVLKVRYEGAKGTSEIHPSRYQSTATRVRIDAEDRAAALEREAKDNARWAPVFNHKHLAVFQLKGAHLRTNYDEDLVICVPKATYEALGIPVPKDTD